jgi:SAM-dependent methyltransferase
MNPSETEWFEANRANWDERVPIHVASTFYDVAGFLEGRNSLQPFERDEVGDVSGLRLLHLQCHFGMDTLSWARLGAHVTGLDFSEPAIDQARGLAAQAGIEARFVCANVYDAGDVLAGEQFDLVYAGVGSLVWLPDAARWARVAASLLAPGGRLYLADGHPLSEVLADDSLVVENSYFGREPQVWDSQGTYTDGSTDTVHNRTYQWAHPISEVISGVLDAGLRLDFFHERDFSLFRRWPFMEFHPEDGTYRMPAGMPSIPTMYSLGATKPR